MSKKIAKNILGIISILFIALLAFNNDSEHVDRTFYGLSIAVTSSFTVAIVIFIMIGYSLTDD